MSHTPICQMATVRDSQDGDVLSAAVSCATDGVTHVPSAMCNLYTGTNLHCSLCACGRALATDGCESWEALTIVLFN